MAAFVLSDSALNQIIKSNAAAKAERAADAAWNKITPHPMPENLQAVLMAAGLRLDDAGMWCGYSTAMRSDVAFYASYGCIMAWFCSRLEVAGKGIACEYDKGGDPVSALRNFLEENQIGAALTLVSQDESPTSTEGITVEELPAMEVETLTGARVWISVDALVAAARVAQSLGA